MTRAATNTIVFLLALASLLTISFSIGVDYSRRQIRTLANELANEPKGTNSFSRCLTEMWEQSGELDQNWKGQRRWHLQ